MKILFYAENSHLRHFPEVIRELTARGHEVTLAHEVVEKEPQRSREAAKLGKNFGVEAVADDLEARGSWLKVAYSLRWTRNQIFFLDPRYDGHEYLQRRTAHMSDPLFKSVLARREPSSLARLDRFLSRLDKAMPLPSRILKRLRQSPPDLLMVTPLIFPLHAYQYDYLRCARALGIPVCFPVFSWDNLTTKGALLEEPDLMLVWNDVQKEEAIRLHGVRADRIAVCGAYRFEEFVARKPSTDRVTYLKFMGLDPERKTLLYIGSSSLCAPKEGKFCADWLTGLRRSLDESIRNANVIVRPHPRNADTFLTIDPQVLKGAYLSIPKHMGGEDLQGLFDALSFCDAVVGINTSAMLESAALGVPVLSIADEVTTAWHKRTLHFEYLASPERGVLHMAPSLAEHYVQLARLTSRPGPDAKSAAFAKSFLGLGGDRSSVQRFGDAIEAFVRGFQPEGAGASVGERSVNFLIRFLVRTRLLPIRRLKTGSDAMLDLKRAYQRGVKAASPA